MGPTMGDAVARAAGAAPGYVSEAIERDGVRLAYRWWPGPGEPAHPPVVLLHGLLQTGEGMANLAAHLARCGPVLVPDLRGRGASSRPADGYDPGTLAADVAALIEAVGSERPVVIGRLHGGLVAYHLAAARPDLVRGLVLGDTVPEVASERAARSLAFLRSLPPRFASEEAALAFYEERLGLSAARARHDMPSDLEPDPAGGLRWRHNLDLIAKIEAASAPRADWDVLARVACPTLLLRGQRGEVPPAMAEQFCRTIAGCRVQTVLGARHDVFLGPGAEQAFGAIELFLLGLVSPEADPDGALSASSPRDNAAGIGPALDPIERVVAAINARDDAAVERLFAPDGRMRQYLPAGTLREGGQALAREAFLQLLDAYPDAFVQARQVVIAGDEAAALLGLRIVGESDDALLLPIFLRMANDRIAELTALGFRPGGNEPPTVGWHRPPTRQVRARRQ